MHSQCNHNPNQTEVEMAMNRVPDVLYSLADFAEDSSGGGDFMTRLIDGYSIKMDQYVLGSLVFCSDLQVLR